MSHLIKFIFCLVLLLSLTLPACAADETDVWTSLNSCESVVSGGRRMTENSGDTIRVATWNIRWFPDGVPSSSTELKPTNLQWLACSIAWMNVDVVAVEEIKTTSRAKQSWDVVTDRLDELTGGDWRVSLSGCGGESGQHLGFLWNDRRLALSDAGQVWELNGAATSADKPCQGSLRPGFQAYFQSRSAEGFDFYAIAVHLDSGKTERDFGHRNTAIDRIDRVAQSLVTSDRDILILGDFNTMGNSQGLSENEEIAELSTKARQEQPGFTRIFAQPACSEYFSNRNTLTSSWLDQILVTQQTNELVTTTATVTGYCALNSCNKIEGTFPAAYRQLSDHCPVIVEFKNRDLD